jgi:hypothetical protein
MGRATGKPKGRPKGALNKATAQIKELAQEYAPAALAELARLAREAESEQARVAACNAILDRGYGKPSQAIDAGPGLERLLILWGVPE